VFDIGFGELLLVFIIGLIVLGPQKLPVAVKTVVGWIRAMRSLASSVQTELAQELKLQELQDSLKKVEKASMSHLTPELKASMDELREAADSIKRPYSHSPRDAEKQSDEEHTIHNPQTQPQAEESAPHTNSQASDVQPQPAQTTRPVATDQGAASSGASLRPGRVLTSWQQAVEQAALAVETQPITTVFITSARPARVLTPLQRAAERAAYVIRQAPAETLQINAAPETVKSLEPTSPLPEKV